MSFVDSFIKYSPQHNCFK